MKYTTQQTSYYCDIEEKALHKWKGEFPTGWERVFNRKWVNHIAKFIDYGVHEDGYYTEEEAKLIAIDHYRTWVKAGNGCEYLTKD